MNAIKSMIAAGAVLASVSAHAAEDSCMKVSGLAQQAMLARQSGELLQDSMKKIGDGSKFASAVIMKAYEKPVEQSEKAKEMSVKEFQNEAYRVCFNANN
ncbi:MULTISPECIES: hypothetical protein [Pseudomonas]|uniref:hypothetical protein n=1 Tax=Pseudomonas TaxID=286 RepID=UPI0015E2C9EA|nr:MULTISPECIES: hypothetical protein [Pseudomonas]MBA1270906.1 hypothetical protein [Pseudomonas carnis]MBJ2224909.1 hypothetical protein [Pseudomonas sp. MF7451]MCP9736538.1 hypothetical protein [Pseudomonas sp. GBPI_506]